MLYNWENQLYEAKICMRLSKPAAYISINIQVLISYKVSQYKLKMTTYKSEHVTHRKLHGRLLGHKGLQIGARCAQGL